MNEDRSPIVRRDRGEPSRSDAARGALVLIGGACTARGEALRSFLDLANARDGGRIVGLTTASAYPERAASDWRRDFHRAGVTNVEIPIFSERHDDRDREIAALIREADGVFLGGGDQVRLVGALSGSHTERAICEAFKGGAAVCGTSAGAAALSELTMAGGEIDEEGNLVEQYIGPGLGMLGFGAIIDTHFSQRHRLQRLFLVVAEQTQLFGVGIDENTALVVRGHIGHVCGAGGVTFVDGRDTVHYDNAREVERGRQLTLSHLRVGIVGTGHSLDLRARELVIPGMAQPDTGADVGATD